MQPSMFNVRVPLEDRNEVFLMNTFTDAQLIVSSDVAELLDRVEQGSPAGPATSATRWPRWRRTASSSRAATRIADNLRQYFHRCARAGSSCA